MIQTRVLTGSAIRTGSPSGTRITLVAHPLLMLAYAITQAITQSWITLGVFTGLILPDQTLNKLEDRGQYLLDEVQGFGSAGLRLL